jgi:hypothetical protein
MIDLDNQSNDECKYPLKVWLTSVFTGPVLLLFNATMPDVVSYFFSIGFVQFYFVALIIGGLCSFPCFLFIWLCFSLLRKKQISTRMIRWSLAITSVLCCISIFILFSLPNLTGFWKRGNVVFIGSYSLPLILSLLLYNIDARDRTAIQKTV